MREPRQFGEALVRSEVNKLVDEFRYPDELGAGGGVVLGGGGGAPSVVVAASDASDLEKTKADYVCIGTNDEDVIQAAIDRMDLAYNAVGNQGYRVLLTAGVFNVDVSGGPIDLGINGGTLQGMGREATVINAGTTVPTSNDEPAIDMLGQRCIVRELAVIGGATNRMTGIRTGGYDNSVEGCLIDTNGYAVIVGADVQVVHNVVVEGSYGFQLSSGSAEVNIVKCNIQPSVGAGIEGLGNNDAVSISNNHIQATLEGIVFSGTGHIRGRIIGNSLGAGRHGISLTDMTDMLIAGNSIYQPGSAADNTYDGIILAGNSDRNDIWHNKIVGKSAANQPRYGINISAATCDDNSYLGNRTGPAADYGTGAYNDAGTGTVNTWPGAAAPQGDNLL